MAASYVFTTTDGGHTFSREFFGFESFLASSGEDGNGLFFYTGSIVAEFATSLSRSELEPLIQSAWVRLRHLVPGVALRLSRPSKGAPWTVTYSVPDKLSLEAWVTDTIVWHDQDEKSLEARDEELSNYTWGLSGGAPTLRLHVSLVSAAKNQWMLSIQGPHAGIDGRMAICAHDELLRSLNLSLADPTYATTRDLVWGTETARLAGAAATLTGSFDKTLAALEADGPPAPPTPPPGFIPFLPAPVENTAGAPHTTHSRVLSLSRAQTTRLRALCRAHGRTVTQAVDALLALADVEASLTAAHALGGAHFASVADAYDASTHWLIALGMKDQRPHFPLHSNYRRTPGTALFATDGYDLALPMSAMRACINFTRADGAFARALSAGTFWDGLVASYAAARPPLDTQKSFVARERAKQAGSAAFSPDPMRVRAFVTSSVGDLAGPALGGALADFAPAAAEDAGRMVQVVGMCHRVRCDLPLMLAVWWQWDGHLQFSFHAGTRYQTDEEFKGMLDAFRRWVDVLLEAQ